MTLSQRATQWFLAPPLSGASAIGLSLLAVAVPTLVRASVQSDVTGVAFTPYTPFVLLAALFLTWQHAAMVAGIGASRSRLQSSFPVRAESAWKTPFVVPT